jgi:hypothetical protein
LKKLQRQMADLEIETVEVTSNPLKSWQDGIRMIPALRGGGKTLSGLLLSTQKIRSFIEKIRAGQ